MAACPRLCRRRISASSLLRDAALARLPARAGILGPRILGLPHGYAGQPDGRRDGPFHLLEDMTGDVLGRRVPPVERRNLVQVFVVEARKDFVQGGLHRPEIDPHPPGIEHLRLHGDFPLPIVPVQPLAVPLVFQEPVGRGKRGPDRQGVSFPVHRSSRGESRIRDLDVALSNQFRISLAAFSSRSSFLTVPSEMSAGLVPDREARRWISLCNSSSFTSTNTETRLRRKSRTSSLLSTSAR